VSRTVEFILIWYLFFILWILWRNCRLYKKNMAHARKIPSKTFSFT